MTLSPHSYFKSKSWALFSLKEPSISFVSDAQQKMDFYDEKRQEEEELVTTIIQTLSISFGQSDYVRNPCWYRAFLLF